MKTELKRSMAAETEDGGLRNKTLEKSTSFHRGRGEVPARECPERLNAIVNHALYREKLRQCEEAEEDRIFCRHDMAHFLDVARLMWIYILEERALGDNENLPARELVYAAALLHDIGRIDQIRDGIPHEKAGAAHAAVILKDCGFSHGETGRICKAIGEHRRKKDMDREVPSEPVDILSELLYRADKKSRACHSCKAEPECDWSRKLKNMEIGY